MTAALSPRNLLRTFREVRQSKSWLAKVRDYRNFLSVHIETDGFIVRTVENSADLLKVLELRHEVFVEEWQGRRSFHRLDVDDYDFQADHLVIIEKVSQQVIGTYRLLCSHFTNDFYSSSEFSLENFLRTPKTKLELGRACIKLEHRNGNSIDLLWRGLARYMTVSKAEYVFGCSSAKSIDGAFMSSLYRDFALNDQWTDKYRIRPTEDYDFPGFQLGQGTNLSPRERREAIPPLLRSYMHAGAMVYGTPALDKEFACADLFTILDMSKLNPKFKDRFF